MSKIIVNEDDGEIVGRIKKGDIIVRKESIDYLNGTIKNWGKGWHFVKTFKEHFAKAAENLPGTAVAVMHILSVHIAYNSNLVCMGGSGNPLNNQDIQDITGYSNKTVVNVMDELVKRKIFARTFVGKSYQYYANPYIYLCGNSINKTLQRMFKGFQV